MSISRPRVAFVLDGPPAAWVARAIERVSAVAHTTTVSLPTVADRTPTWLRLFDRLDAKLLARGVDDPCGRTSIGGRVELTSVAALAALVAERQVDVVVDLTADERVAPGSLPAAVWAIRHDGRPAGSPLSLARAFARGDATCTTELVSRVASGDRVVYRTRSLVRRISLRRTRAAAYWKAAALPARVISQPQRDLGPAERAAADAPAAAQVVRRVAGGLGRLGRDRFAGRPSWSLAWRNAGDAHTEEGAFTPAARLDPPADAFYADPFVAVEGGRHFVFYEAYRRRLGRADLVVRELGATVGPPHTILARPYHLSYPFVFRSGDTHYLVPESADAGRVELLRATAFPWVWRTEATLLDGVAAYDPTLLEHNGTWFLFVAIAEPGADIDELHVFHADDLHGPYRPHPLNPVVSDVARARPAGRIYRERGRLMRPAQDGSGGYGSALVLNEIVRLSVDEYEERPFTRLLPTWDAGALGMHTINHDGTIEVVDVKTLQPRWRRRAA